LVSVGKDFVILGGDRIEVSPDGKKVTAYTNDGVETKAAKPAPVPEAGCAGYAKQWIDEAPPQGISISWDFNTVVLNGATIERAADGHLVISTPGTVITKPGPANGNNIRGGEAALQIGDKMPAGHKHAGWIYAGISRTTHEPFYVAPKDSGVFQWKEAMAFAAKDGSRVPSKEELDQIHEARNQGALRGTFNVTGSYPAGWYWSSSQLFNDFAWAQRFSAGDQYYDYNGNASSLRCVR
jgi:hypothetical protein